MTHASAPRPPHPASVAAVTLALALSPVAVPAISAGPTAGAGGAGGDGWASVVRVAPAAAAAQQEGPVTLRLAADEGETLTYRFRSRTHVSPPPGMGMEATADATMLVRQTVEAVEGDTLRMRSRIDSFTLDLTSDNEQVRSQLRRQAEESREKILEETFRLAMTRRAEMVEMGSIAGGGGGIQQLDRSIRRLSFATLPAEPVAVGDTWSARRTADAASFGLPVEGEVVTRSTSTLERIFRRGGSRVAEISVESTFAFRTDSAAASPMKVHMEGSSAQTVRFDIDRGRFLSSSGAQDITMNLSLPGQTEGSLSVQTTAETSATLVED